MGSPEFDLPHHGCLTRPILGGTTTGVHYQRVPRVDEVIVLREQNGWKTTKANPMPLPIMNFGETAIYRTDGSVALYAKTGQTMIGNMLVLTNQTGLAGPVAITGTSAPFGPSVTPTLLLLRFSHIPGAMRMLLRKRKPMSTPRLAPVRCAHE
jgi:hypothetical protein